MLRTILLSALALTLPLSAQVRRDACALASVPELSAAMGMPMLEGKATGLAEPECQWRSRNFQLVTIRLHPGASPQFDPYVAKASKQSRAKPEPLADLGERAAYVPGVLVLDYKGSLIVVSIHATLLTPPERKDAAVRIAQSAILHFQ